MERIKVKGKEAKLIVLNALNKYGDKKVMCAEQHIDKYFDNIVQCEINNELGLTMKELTYRLCLHGPDILVIEEE